MLVLAIIIFEGLRAFYLMITGLVKKSSNHAFLFIKNDIITFTTQVSKNNDLKNGKIKDIKKGERNLSKAKNSNFHYTRDDLIENPLIQLIRNYHFLSHQF